MKNFIGTVYNKFRVLLEEINADLRRLSFTLKYIYFIVMFSSAISLVLEKGLIYTFPF